MTSSRTVEDAVDRVAELLEARVGLRGEPTVRSRLRRCVRDEAAEHGLDMRSYVAAVATGGAAFEALLDRVTVQETGFFRHPEQFAALVDTVLPTLRAPIRFWSAACANGQEAYSLAMILAEQGIDGSIVATDLSVAALHRTAAGHYAAREMAGLSPDRVARHMVPAGRGWEVAGSLKERVAVLRYNLVDPVPDEVRSSQVVFCRNVLIYIAHERARAFLHQVAEVVAPVALFVGSAEAIWPLTDRFEAVRVGDAFLHRPRRPAAPEPPAAGRLPIVARPGFGPAATARASVGLSAARRQPRARPSAEGAAVPSGGDVAVTTALTSGGQRALTAGDPRSAVVSFRKWAYLAPDDGLAHLHLGLALEAAGDGPAAQRAYAVARRLVLDSDPADIERATKGYARDEVIRLLDAKRRLAP